MKRKFNWNDEKQLREIIDNSMHFTEVLRKIGLCVHGNNHKTLKKYINKFEISTEHFYESRTHNTKEIPLNDILKGLHPHYNNHNLKRRLIKNKILEEVCHICGMLPLWNNKPLVLQLDHIDGDNTNHKQNNLRFLCPNCHTQTPTFAGKNQAHVGQIKDSRKYGNRKTYFKCKKDEYIELQKEYIPLVKNSNIEFSKHGWVTKVSEIINQKPQKVKLWMLKIMPEFYEDECFKRK